MWVTKKGYEALHNKLADLKEEVRKKLKELGQQAAMEPDLPENPIWKQLNVELRFNLPKRIADLQKIIAEAHIIEDALKSKTHNQNVVYLGARVKVKIDNEERIFILVGPYDIEVISNSVSYLSPLGKTLLGAEIYEEKTFIAPKGERTIKILSIEKGI